MHLSAVWLRRSNKHLADVFVPYTPNFAGMRLGRTCKRHRTESLLKKHALQMILRWYERYERGLNQLGTRGSPAPA